MVKLFVGGLPEGVDSIRLRQLFSQFVIVNECDVIKDYAFVHVAEETDARTAIEKLDGYILEGKAINIRRSTSRMRKEPGMDKRCFRCGTVEHKTPQCPNDPANMSLKRTASASGLSVPVEQKRFNADVITSDASSSFVSHPSDAHVAVTQGPTSYVYGAVGPQVLQAGFGAEPDPMLPRPLDSDLFPLYEQYMESRTKYFYFRERLTKEVKARAQLMPPISVAPLQAPYANANIYNTPPPSNLQYSAQQTVALAPVSNTVYPISSHFYGNAVGASVAYTPVVNTQPNRLF